MNLDFQRSCLGKRPYLSQEEALAVKKEIRKSGKSRRFTGLDAYKCRWCAYWHIGHSKRVK